ncbi:hypothetical protein vBPaeME215_00063 [Pseudomonas phage vB_PaeM_E215]|uniref:Uncharacterized protein n=1 Tax=Pseudomonas phage vB_PaeM_E215 TaxID=2034347 RepID=A0A2K8HP26_9CAUD|nr:hypothetical protein FDJ05_gp63 [Pseudomonas phage vB_PaeM_E215]ASZ72541.1 hypothetical protein vBPaeME215_00063 [Pseudomonas phage vB_PaeM_E215]
MKLYHAKVSPPSFYRHNQTDEERKVLEAEYVSKLHILLGNLEGVTIGNPGERNWEPSTWSNDVPVMCNEIGLGRLTASAWDLDKDYPYTIINLVLLWDDVDPEAALRPMLERLELAASRLAGRSEGYINQPQMVDGIEGWNSHTSSAIPGPNLHSVNRLLLKEDCCTDELQSALDAGWRLLAVCPQEARRPDYILGRFDSVPPTGPRGAARSID